MSEWKFTYIYHECSHYSQKGNNPMVGATVACGQQWLHSLKNAQASFAFHSLAHCFSIAVDISAALSK